ncbi:Parvulin-like peptidyl-prolyl isomerase [Bryocella elongata]|uniref:Parvulin-like peptidyl-prolyl isomerase n=1 Tax=Bryocella elongata TaxID=863522 RepID=A0A1H5TGE8_9BACT|nr:peptidylprolyl isomerase [Bryocella elongata]SEF61161.1 Parvulin-like peptidyl-prolyl isomerase [Bryocella elongata]
MPLIVNGEPVSDEAIAHQLRLLQQTLLPEASLSAADDPRIFAIAEENAVLQVLLRQAAARRHPDISPDDIAAELARRRGTPQSVTCSHSERDAIIRALQIERLMDEIVRTVPRPPAKEVEASYIAQRERFREPETLQVRHIIANVDGVRDEALALATITEAREALDAGEAFHKVADRFSDCAGVGGDLGWIARGEMVEEFDDVVFALKPGTVSETFRTVFGFHIATVLARRAPRQLGLSEVRAQIARELHDDRKQAAVLTYLRGLAAQSEIRRTGVSV